MAHTASGEGSSVQTLYTHTHTSNNLGEGVVEGGAAFLHLEPGTCVVGGRGGGILHDLTFPIISGVTQPGSIG